MKITCSLCGQIIFDSAMFDINDIPREIRDAIKFSVKKFGQLDTFYSIMTGILFAHLEADHKDYLKTYFKDKFQIVVE